MLLKIIGALGVYDGDVGMYGCPGTCAWPFTHSAGLYVEDPMLEFDGLFGGLFEGLFRVLETACACGLAEYELFVELFARTQTPLITSYVIYPVICENLRM